MEKNTQIRYINITMHNNKICLSKKFSYFLLLITVIVVSVYFYTNFFISNSTKSKASTISSNTSKQPLKIVGGEKALDNEFPFFVELYFDNKKGLTICGGALISDEWIVTAAHCVYDANQEKSRIEAFIGLNHFDKQLRMLHYSLIDVDKIIINEKYVPSKFANSFKSYDIALLHLTQKAEGIPTISIPDPSIDRNGDGKVNNNDFIENITGKEGVQGIIMGFGTTKISDSLSEDLLKAFMIIDKRLPFQIPNIINLSGENFFNQTRPGHGDSGGPLLVNYKKKFFLIGVTSSSSYNSGQFSSVSYYSSWIHDKTSIPYESGTYISPFNSTIPYPVQHSFNMCLPTYTIDECFNKSVLCDWDRDTNTCALYITDWLLH